MAITVKIAATTAADSGAGTEFITTAPFVLYGDDFGVDEHAILTRLGPSGAHKPMTNKDGVIMVSAFPNTVLVDAFGTFRLIKTVTAVAASVGYEEQ